MISNQKRAKEWARGYCAGLLQASCKKPSLLDKVHVRCINLKDAHVFLWQGFSIFKRKYFQRAMIIAVGRKKCSLCDTIKTHSARSIHIYRVIPLEILGLCRPGASHISGIPHAVWLTERRQDGYLDLTIQADLSNDLKKLSPLPLTSFSAQKIILLQVDLAALASFRVSSRAAITVLMSPRRSSTTDKPIWPIRKYLSVQSSLMSSQTLNY